MPVNKGQIKKHVTDLGQLATSPGFADAVADLAEDEDAGGKGPVTQAKQNPHGFFEQRGVKLPPGAKVTVEASSPLRISICLNGFCVGWTF